MVWWSPILLGLWFLVGPTDALAQSAGGNVILTFDAEVDEDAAALRRLGVDEPATYFFTGTFVENHPDLVARLAENGNTIGSHSYSHADLTQLDEMELRKELLLPKLIIERTTGITPVWFRAPYLVYDERTMGLLDELGFRFDSSDQERWTQDQTLAEMPISVDDESAALASDYDLFEQSRLTDDQALDWLRQQYQARVTTGRPLVILMHPRIIGRHPHTLLDFIDYVHKQGGTFLTADQWLQTALDRSPGRWGTWVDFSLGPHDPETIAADVVEAGLTDVFLMARDPAGNVYYTGAEGAPSATPDHDLFGETAALLRANGVRVHAWLPIFHNSYLAQMRPDLAMVRSDGIRSLDWLAPTQPEVEEQVLDTIVDLIRRYQIDGIHLDYFRYPDLEHDLGPQALAAFGRDTDLENVTAARAVSEYYTDWTDWRMDQLSGFAGEIRETMSQTSDRALILSAALIADAALTYRSMEEYGQDYAGLARHLDIVMPMAYFKEDQRPLGWIEDVVLATRYRVGAKAVFTGVEGYQQPERWSLDPIQFGTSLRMAGPGSDGVAIYPYLYMFGRGEDGWNMPSASLPVLTEAITRPPVHAEPVTLEASEPREPPGAAATPEPSLDPPTERPSGWNGWAVGLLTLAGMVGLGAAVVVGRSKAPLGGTSPPALPATPYDDGALARFDWSRARGEAGRAAFATLLRQLGPIGIERCRVTFVLDLLERSDGDVASLLDDLSQIEGWNRLALRYLEQSSLLGYVALEGKRASLTPLGMQHLRRAREQGFRGSLWRDLEVCLHERIDLTCPRCGGYNQGHWFWQDVECIQCRHPIEVRLGAGASQTPSIPIRQQ